MPSNLRTSLFPPLLAACALAAGDSPGEDPLGDRPVLEIDGSVITLRHVENSALEQEGVDLLIDLVRQRLRDTDWERVDNDEVIIALGDWRLTRAQLAAHLLRRHGGRVRKDLMETVVAEKALRRAGVIVDQALLRAEFKRVARAFRRQSLAQTGAILPFEEWLKEKKGMTVDEFMADPAFRMLTGLHELVRRSAEIPEATLRTYFKDRYDDFAREEQVEISLIGIPFPDNPLLIERDKEKLRQTVEACYRRIESGRSDFGREFRLLGRPYDRQAERDGRIGWVAADGARPGEHAGTVPSAVIEACFAIEGPIDGPVLLRPISTDQGVYLAQVHGRRPALHPTFAQAADAVRAAYIEANLDRLTQELQHRLSREADITFHSLAELVNARWEQAKPRPAGEDDAEDEAE